MPDKQIPDVAEVLAGLDRLAELPRFTPEAHLAADAAALIRHQQEALRVMASAQGRMQEVAQEAHDALGRVRELHTPEKRWQIDITEGSYDSREDAIEDWCECDGECRCEPVYFEVCAECGRIESGDDDREWSYRESIWPCATAKALAGDSRG